MCDPGLKTGIENGMFWFEIGSGFGERHTPRIPRSTPPPPPPLLFGQQRVFIQCCYGSLLAKHHMLHSHQIDLTSVEIVDRSSAWRQRLILEAWHSMRNTNAINEHIALPNVYNNIKNL